ncbi:hypothetical protein FOA52_001197 [Chlamydomonas sp. UWO 241]|nr:hypothetical protein FOA52_001197 [Chlamydomonas sp. UWO 241]
MLSDVFQRPRCSQRAAVPSTSTCSLHAAPLRRLVGRGAQHTRRHQDRDLTNHATWQTTAPILTPSARRPSAAVPEIPVQGSAPEDVALPIFVALDKAVMNSSREMAYPEALSAGLKALKVLGITGVSVDVHWGLVEGKEPGVYDWTGYRNLLRLISDFGFRIHVSLCFHATPAAPLPRWVVAEGEKNPDIYYTDKAGGRSLECLTLGVNDVPVLRGRTAVDVYAAFMHSFKGEFSPWFGNTITEVLVGLGPKCELKYPAHPLDSRWSYPGVGEFQCYDRFMLATLKACADQLEQPSWGLSGPHDAGSYCLWPHQTGFFHQHGSWTTPYGRFFMQWYSEMLARHADAVLSSARDVFASSPLNLAVRVPGSHWWYNTASHAPELTSGYYNTAERDGYLPVFRALARHRVGVHLTLAEARSRDEPAEMFCDPERLLSQQVTVAASQRLPVVIENDTPRFDAAALSRLESVLFDTVTTGAAIDVPPPAGLTFNCLTDEMFEPNNWRAFKAFVLRVRERSEAQSGRSEACAVGADSVSQDRQTILA